eukprot:2224192-Heterocapsa_arctica.AAC.1
MNKRSMIWASQIYEATSETSTSRSTSSTARRTTWATVEKFAAESRGRSQDARATGAGCIGVRARSRTCPDREHEFYPTGQRDNALMDDLVVWRQQREPHEIKLPRTCC